ncbi:hypothetical protein EG327_000223 [Venturia inaequalis]|uniref:Uncharacterized protein n=1 Tax=Venturia inaequalis TaxID=5025 RepID=A0A8H3VQS1_VENIN|nr:hypothetical protein EG327_000223 [Venturia inaequalis]
MAPTLKRGREADALDEDQDDLSTRPAKLVKSSSDIRSFFTSSPPSSNATALVSTTKPRTKNASAEPITKKTPVKTTAKKASAKSTTTTKKTGSIDSDYARLLKDYVYNPNGWNGVTADNFSSEMAVYTPAITKLGETRSKDAFNLLMYASEHCYGDLEFCFKSSGFGETEEPFKEMDEAMVKIIEKRVVEEGKGEMGVVGDVYVADGNGELAAFMEELGGKERLNKSERGKQLKYRRLDFKNGVAKRRELREVARDWIGNALADLVRTRDFIEQYGIGEFYFAHSIAKLEGMKVGEA